MEVYPELSSGEDFASWSKEDLIEALKLQIKYRESLSLQWEEEYERANDAEARLAEYEDIEPVISPPSPTVSFSSMICEAPNHEGTITAPPENSRPTATSTSYKGREGEDLVHKYLVESAPVECQIVKTRDISYHADLMLIYTRNDEIIGYAMIDVKNYQGPVPETQIRKFKRDVTFCTGKFGVPPIWGAVVSLRTKITCRPGNLACNFLSGPSDIELVHGVSNSTEIVKLFERTQQTVNYALEKFLDNSTPKDIISKRDRELKEIMEELDLRRQIRTLHLKLKAGK